MKKDTKINDNETHDPNFIIDSTYTEDLEFKYMTLTYDFNFEYDFIPTYE